ncbi:nuclear transport factor 2 family protein [Sphingomonas morindae]|uniref:Nuclear transport factor 2 family protein n=1 Tax=Sphingomonas morindae TaxID=1541170 RepID=A0ABY4X7S5_9SPHN|nr:nuclear transport factor 2 family protein [Sphingomonas morindae]USI73004.1 nuclear transport factor 2 family protein [Sphingomonas morindae]
MRLPPFLPALLLALAWPAAATQAATACSAEVRAVDDQFRRAMIEGDGEALDRIIADDAIIIHGHHGGVQGKRGLIRSFRAYRISRYDRTPFLCRVAGGTAILVSATAKRVGDKEVAASTTEIFILRTHRWRLLVLQNTDRTPD